MRIDGEKRSVLEVREHRRQRFDAEIWQKVQFLIFDMDSNLLNLLACPLCKGHLHYDKSVQELICTLDQIAYPIQDNIPVMLEEAARKLDPLQKVV